MINAVAKEISGLDNTLDAAAKAAPEIDLPPVEKEHYDIVAEKGRGGMGRVMVAWDRRLRREVAVKELLTARPEAMARFVREALLTAQLQHPSIVPVHEAGRWPSGEPFYSMKMVQGQPLDVLLRATRSFADRLALLPVVIAVAEALAYAHSKRVLHRDIKPANVIVGEFGETVLLDWGLAKELGEDQSSVEPSREVQPGQTMDGAVVGTPGYMSPEQASGESVDIRTDVYALGALLYNVLSGEIPFRGRTPIEVLNQIVEGKVVPIRQREPQVPDELVDIVHKALAHKRADRYDSARELAADLKRFSLGQLVAAHRYSVGELLKRWLWKYRVVVAISTAALLLVASFGGWSVRRVLRERSLALEAQARAEAAQRSEAERVDELIVQNARAVVDHDPTRSLAWLKHLRPGSSRWPEALVVARDARKRGVAEHLFHGHEGPAEAISFSADGKWLISGGKDLRLWSLAGAPPRVLSSGEITQLAFAGAELLTIGERVTLWDLGTGSARTLHGGRAIAMSISGYAAAIAGDDQSIRLWDLASGAARGVIRVGRPITSVALFGSQLAARGDGWVRRFDAPSGKLLQEISLAGDGEVKYSSTGILAAGGMNRLLLGARHFDAPGGVTHLAFSPDGAKLAGAGDDGTVRWWDVASGEEHPLAHKGESSRDVLFARDGNHLVATRGDTIRLWVLPDAEPRKLRGPAQHVSRVAISPDGERVATAAYDGVVRVYRLGPGLLPAESEPPVREEALRAWLNEVTDATE
jgi:hypothetical protein